MSYKNNRFLTDYEVHEYIKPNGKVGEITTYIGEYFVFKNPDIARDSRRILLLSLISFVSFAAACCFFNEAFYTVYITVAFFLLLVPYWFLARILYYVFVRKAPYERYFAEYIMNRFPPCALGLMVLPAVSFVGTLILFITGKISTVPGNIVLLISCLIQALCGVYMFTHRHDLDLFVAAN